MTPEIVNTDDIDPSDLMVHDSKCSNAAYPTLLAEMSYPTFPTPLGVIRRLEGRETYEDSVVQQINSSQANGEASLQELLTGKNSWVVE